MSACEHGAWARGWQSYWGYVEGFEINADEVPWYFNLKSSTE